MGKGREPAENCQILATAGTLVHVKVKDARAGADADRSCRTQKESAGSRVRGEVGHLEGRLPFNVWKAPPNQADERADKQQAPLSPRVGGVMEGNLGSLERACGKGNTRAVLGKEGVERGESPTEHLP